jgi:hypothetical protein
LELALAGIQAIPMTTASRAGQTFAIRSGNGALLDRAEKEIRLIIIPLRDMRRLDAKRTAYRVMALNVKYKDLSGVQAAA